MPTLVHCLITLITLLGIAEGVPLSESLNYGPTVSRVTPKAWKALNDSVGGRLFAALPVGYPCFDNFEGTQKSTNPSACALVEANKNNTLWIASQMSGYTKGNVGICLSNYTGCPVSPLTAVDETAGCGQGNIPDYYVDVRSVDDVKAGLDFARKYSIPLVVKNSGHDYVGRSAGRHSLALWMYNYTPEPSLNPNFIPDRCNDQGRSAITFGAGESFDSLYNFAHQNDVNIIGGSAEDIAPAGGWITTGGHSILSSTYGLGVDNVVQLKVVLPNGTYVAANRCQNQDIFFAQQGGGGGTFGVNMEMSMIAYPNFAIQWVNMTFVALTIDQQSQLMEILVQNANAWFDAGWGGYAYPVKHSKYPDQTFSILFVNPRLDKADSLASLKPLLDFAHSLGVQENITTYESFYDFYVANVKTSPIKYSGNYGIAEASRLIPRHYFDDSSSQEALTQALVNAVTETAGDVPLILMVLLVTPKQGLPDTDASISPAWRSSTWHVISIASWDPTTVNKAQNDGIFESVHLSMQGIRSLTPDGGAYLSEGDAFEPHPRRSFWGTDNYQRLLRIKREVDPQNIMQVYNGIGWDSGAERFQCSPKNPN